MATGGTGETGGDVWVRDGGRVCLDFVNTLRDRWSEPRDTLGTADDVRRWLEDAGLLDVSARGDDVLKQARALREAVDHALLDVADGGLPAMGDMAVINETAAGAPRPAPRLVIVNGRLEAEDAAGLTDDAVAALGIVAQDAIDLLASPEVQRVRVCSSERCGLRFLDRSPARNRRWCSMARCGTRAKARSQQTRADRAVPAAPRP